MSDRECSFCGTILPPQVKGQPELAVAGPMVFICRDCVGICVEVMAASDPQWRDQQAAILKEMHDADPTAQ